MRLIKYQQSKSRLQSGEGIGDVLLKIAKVLGPSALKALEGVAEGVGKKVGKMISGEGGVQGLQASEIHLLRGYGAKLAGGGSRLAGGGFRLAGEPKKICPC